MQQLPEWGNEGGAQEEDVRIQTAREKIDSWRKEGGAVSNLNRSDLTLLRTFISAPEQYQDIAFFSLCDFLDQEEALDHVAAYYEAKELGMDTGFNFAYMMALTASNRKTDRSNRVHSILASLNSFRYITNQPRNEKEAKQAGDGQRGPLSG